MAGLGRKDFQAGAVLSAADVDGYLMDQSVMKFANTAAAGSAYGTAIAEGMNFYLSDTDEVVFHNGTSFVKQAAGDNLVANGDFADWTRGTSLTESYFNAGNLFSSDRWKILWNNTPTAVTVARQSFTAGTAPVAGYEGQYFFRSTITTVGTNSIWRIYQTIEDVRNFAGQTATLSFWAKADSARTTSLVAYQNFGTGGSASVDATLSASTVALTTSWQRFTITASFASIAGKTIGAGNFVGIGLTQVSASGSVLDIWGVQLESGAVATPFKPAGGNSALDTVTSGSAGFDGVLVSTNSASNPSGSGTPAWAGYDVAGKNKIINGGFDFWQRGTSAALSGSTSQFLADRFQVYRGVAGSTASQQTGFNGLGFSLRVQRDSGNTSATIISMAHNLESATARELAGQTVTLSFKAIAGANFTAPLNILVATGTGTDQNLLITGYTGQSNVLDTNQTLTTSWVRYSYTFNLASTANEIGILWRYTPTGTAGAADYYQIDEVQLEAGSVATPFSRAGGTLQGELAACQRYLPKLGGNDNYEIIGTGWASGSTTAEIIVRYPVTTRVSPSAIEYSSLTLFDGVSSLFPITALTVAGGGNGTNGIRLVATVSSGLTQYRPYELLTNNTTAGYLRLPAEL